MTTMIETIIVTFFFIGAIAFVVEMTIDGYKAHKVHTDELETLNKAVESYHKLEGNHWTMDKRTKEISVYTIDEARWLYDLSPINVDPIEQPKKEGHLYNCPNCGAPITGDKCEYCGTVFRDRKEDAEILYADNRPILTLYNRINEN